MPGLAFDYEWETDDSVTGVELASTCASLTVRLHDTVLTRVVDDLNGRVRDHVHVSLYPLAEWLASNWWFLLHESDYRTGREDGAFLQRHSLGPSREGYRYPNLCVFPQGTKTRVTWKHLGSPWSGVQFLSRSGDELIERDQFVESCEGLVDAIAARLASSGVKDTCLQEEWQAIRTVDPAERKFCEMAAALGLDPYDMDGSQSAALMQVEGELEGAVREEALPILRSGRLGAQVASITQLLRMTRQRPLPLQRIVDAREEIQRGIRCSAQNPPWTTGYLLARTTRSTLGLNGTALRSWASLSKALGEPRIQKGRLPRSRVFGDVAGLEGVVACNGDGDPALSFRARGHGASDRFLFCRAVAEVITGSQSDTLLTRSRSERQQVGRAFAAEFLVPSESLRQQVDREVLDEDEVDDLARRFGVSSSVIEHQVAKHEIATMRRSLSPPM